MAFRVSLLGRAVLAATALSLTMAATATATPGDDATIVASSYTATSTGMRTVTPKTVTCPAGQRVVGGGNGPAGTVDPFSLSMPISGPLDETGTAAATNNGDVARVWFAATTNVNASSIPYPERAFANCSANSDAVIAVTTDSVSAPPTTSKTLTTMCPAGSRAVGGGFAPLSSADDFGLRSSSPVDETGDPDQTFTNEIARGWSVVVSKGSGTSAFSVFALCSQGSDATLVVDSFSAVSVGETSGDVMCGANRRALGGGVGLTVPFPSSNPYLTASAPISAAGTTAATNNGDVARGWFASAFNTNGPAIRYSVFAICGSDPGFGVLPDTEAPDTSITQQPKRKTKKPKATFAFSSSEAGSTFECKVDTGTSAACTSPAMFKVTGNRKGRKHAFSVVAVDAAGNRDASPATYSWKVRKKSKKRG